MTIFVKSGLFNKNVVVNFFKEQNLIQFIYQIMDNEGLIEGHIIFFYNSIIFWVKNRFFGKDEKLCREGFFKKQVR